MVSPVNTATRPHSPVASSPQPASVADRTHRFLVRDSLHLSGAASGAENRGRPDVVIEELTEEAPATQHTAVGQSGPQAGISSASGVDEKARPPLAQTGNAMNAASPSGQTPAPEAPKSPKAGDTSVGSSPQASSPPAATPPEGPESPTPLGKVEDKPSLLEAVNGWTKSPLPWHKRAIAFLSFSNLKVGSQAGSAIFRDKDKWGKALDVALMVGDMLMIPLTLGLNVLLALHFPGLQLSDTLRAFGKGVHLGASGVGKAD